MSNRISGSFIPADVPGAGLEPADMQRVSADDWADIARFSRGYCRTVDASRSRKRMDGSATVVREFHAPYGTDDVSDDVAQDAVLLFAQRLKRIMGSCEVAAQWIDSRQPMAWLYTRKDGEVVQVDRRTLQRWAVRDAAKRNGYRIDVEPDPGDVTPGAQVIGGVRHAEHVAAATLVTAHLSQQSEAVFRTAYGDGADYPTLRKLLFVGNAADDLGRAGVLATVAQAEHGGAYGSRRNVRRTRDAAVREWQDLTERLDQARDDMIYHGMRDDHA